MQLAQAEGLKVKLLIPKLLYPVAEEIYREFFASLRKCLVIEQSHQGQLYRLIRMWVTVPPEFQSLAKSGANPITPGGSAGRNPAPGAALNHAPFRNPDSQPMP